MKGKVFKIIALFFIACISFTLFCGKLVNANAFFSKFTIVADGKEYIFYYPEISYGLDGATLLGEEQIVDRIIADNKISPTDARVDFTPAGKNIFTYYKQKSGRIIDKQKAIAKIEHALHSGKNKVVLTSEKVDAKITIEELKKQTVKKSYFCTEYQYSSKERKHNIALAVSYLSGAIIDPGETFSFNQTVGKREEERGFLTAKVIQDGKFIDGVGGGVCQVSTTLYNAVLLAGLTVKESHNHSLAVDYVQPSFDAMVSDYTSDLKFENNTNSPIYILGSADGERVSFTIFGVKNEYDYWLVSTVTEIIEGKTVTEKRRDGSEVDLIKKDGLKSEGYLQVYKDGVLIKTVKLRCDTYKPREGVNYID